MQIITMNPLGFSCFTLNKLFQLLLLLLALLVSVSLQAKSTNGGNILAIFPHFGFSHFKVVQPILLELAERGHKVTVISYVKNSQSHPNYEELLISDVVKKGNSSTINVADLDEFTPTRSLGVLLHEYLELSSEGQKTCELLYGSPHVAKVLQRHQKKPYDLLFTEYFNSDCQLGVAHLLQTPVVALTTCALMPWYYDRINLPDTPAYVQSEFIGFPATLNWRQRLVNFLQAKILKTLYRYRTNTFDNVLVRRHLKIHVDVDAVARAQTAAIFVNQHYTLMGSRPHSRQLVEIGGVHIDEEATNSSSKLPHNIVNFLDNADEGVIFISWGSMLRASSIDNKRLDAMITILKQQPQKVIWKWESNELPTKSKRFLFIKWAPQLALLGHPKVKLFWTHGGLLGTTEAIHCGKPILVTPIYGDQFLNAHAVQNRGIGLKLDYNDIKEASLERAMQEALKPHFARRAKQFSKIFKDRENAPLDTAVWAIEHQLKHGQLAGELLRSPATQMNWFIYYSLDSIVLLILGVILALWVLKFILGLLCPVASPEKKPLKNKVKHT